MPFNNGWLSEIREMNEKEWTNERGNFEFLYLENYPLRERS